MKELYLEKRPFTELYIHVPFCAGKCDYCAFYSEGKWEGKDMQAYAELLLAHLERSAAFCAPLRTIYLGGGTPTLLPPAILEKIFSSFSHALPLAEDLEISCECNPESLTDETAALLGKYVHRVTMGVQSFSPANRKLIGRKGGENSLEKAFHLLQKYGINNIGLDLIYALPFQRLEEWKMDLEKALSFPVRHLSCYALSLEEGTPLFARSRKEGFPENGDLEAEMWEYTGNFLKEKGFPRYEISNYASPSFASNHNVHVWEGAPYLGVGPGACSFDGEKRFMEVQDLHKWLAGKAPERDEVPPLVRLAEIFIMGLRKCSGWQEEEWRKVTAFPWKELFPKAIEKGLSLELLEEKEKALLPTEKGLAFWNDLAELFPL